MKDDLFGGSELGAHAVREGVAYATLAGLPPQVGIYGYLLGGLGYPLFGSSRHLAIGPTSAISLMVRGFSGVPGHGRSCALWPDCNSFGICSSCFVRHRMAVATKHIDKLYQRNGPARFQGRSPVSALPQPFISI